MSLCLNALRHLALYLEDKNDISDKVQTMNSDCCLMELIYSFFFSFLSFFFFGFFCVFQGNLNRNHMFCACKPLSPCGWVLWISQTWWGEKMMLIPLCNATLCLSERYYLGKCYLWKRSNTIVYLCAPVNYSTPLILPPLTSQKFGIAQCSKYTAVCLIQLHWWTIIYLWQTRLKHYMADMPCNGVVSVGIAFVVLWQKYWLLVF